MRRTPSQGATIGLAEKATEAIRIETTGQWGPCADVRRSPRQGAAMAVAAKAHDMVKVHRVLAHPSEEIMQKTVQAMGITTTGQWGPCEARLQMKAKRQAVQWIDGPDKTGSNDLSDEDLDVKPGEDESAEKRGATQHYVRKLELEQPQSPDKGTQEAPPDPEGEARQASPDPGDETEEALLGPISRHGRRHWIPGRQPGKCHRITKKRHERRHRISTRRHERRYWILTRRQVRCHRILRKRHRRRRRIPRRRQRM